jgi:hypothetical protein
MKYYAITYNCAIKLRSGLIEFQKINSESLEIVVMYPNCKEVTQKFKYGEIN